jgi:hypothetical protein
VAGRPEHRFFLRFTHGFGKDLETFGVEVRLITQDNAKLLQKHLQNAIGAGKRLFLFFVLFVGWIGLFLALEGVKRPVNALDVFENFFGHHQGSNIRVLA